MLNRACLSLGSNLQPELHLPAAVRELRSLGEIHSVSSVWQSAPIGAPQWPSMAIRQPAQPDYCNLALLLDTLRTTDELLSSSGPLREIESRLGRVRDPHNKYAARTIDIDLVCECSGVGSRSGKSLPDPDLRLRACIAVPVSELDGLEVPGLSRGELIQLAERLRTEQPLTPRPDIDAAVACELAATRGPARP